MTRWWTGCDGAARVADLGCGFGYSTIIIAEAFPRSTFVGIDYHAASADAAGKAAADAGVGDRVTFEVAGATNFRGGYDLITCYDCLHDMGDPEGVARRVRAALVDDGTWMIVAPAASGRLEENFHPIGRFFLAASLPRWRSACRRRWRSTVLGRWASTPARTPCAASSNRPMA